MATIKDRPKRFVPSYVRVAEDLQDKIRQGQLASGDFLPGMRALASEYGVGIATVQLAVSNLVAEGILRSDGWRGTLVADTVPEKIDSLPPFSPILLSPTVTIGVIAPIPTDGATVPTEMKDHWAIAMLRGLERVLGGETGITVRFENVQRADGSMRPVNEAVQTLIDENVDALAVVYATSDTQIDATLAQIDARQLPTVFVSTEVPNRSIPYVSYDGVWAGFDAAQHLIRRGYQRLLFLSPFRATWAKNRITGAREAVMRAGLPAETLAVLSDESIDPTTVYQPDAGYAFAQTQLAAIDIRSCGIIMVNDNAAMGFLRAAQEVGLIAGRDYGLIGFDDRLFSRELGLTTLVPPLEAMGEDAGHLLLRLMRGDQCPMQIQLRSHLLARTSTRALTKQLNS